MSNPPVSSLMTYLFFHGRLILVYSDPKKAGSTLAILDGDKLRQLSTPYASYGSLSIGQTGKSLTCSAGFPLLISLHPHALSDVL